MRQRVPTGNPWGDSIGYSRAVRVGNLVFVSGTTATAADGSTLAIGQPGAQARIALERIASALAELGAALKDVVDTKIYLAHIDHWPEVGRVHGEFFRDIKPAATMVAVSRFISPDMLVEISATAVLEVPRAGAA